ncbi:hypothetical protein ABW19_dt0202986 [Dactylella cylindrospora]|nr:hypothetical protein ABW19_dt0202986 [Dactylella cylindrospora]
MSDNPPNQIKPSSGELADELESFRRQWKEDLKSTKQPATSQSKGESSGSAPTPAPAQAGTAAPSRAETSAHRRRQSQSVRDDIHHAPGHILHGQHDHHEDAIRSLDLDAKPTPSLSSGERILGGSVITTALEHYEAAVEKEREGKTDESVRLYRKAFKMDTQVHDKYKEKYFPRQSTSGQAKTGEQPVSTPKDEAAILPTAELVHTFGSIPIIPGTEINLASLKGKDSWRKPPPCPISRVPREILIQIFSRLAETDVASFVRCVAVSKAFCYLVYSERQIWKNLCEDAWSRMVWGPLWACDTKGKPLAQRIGSGEDISSVDNLSSTLSSLAILEEEDLEDDVEESSIVLPTRPSNDIEVLKYNSSYRTMFIERARIRYNGVYISTCSYFRSGHSVNTNLTLSNPIHQVTYYRYLRFFPSGFVLTLLTPTEPGDVVHSITLENYKSLTASASSTHHQNPLTAPTLPSSLHHLKGLLPGRWRVSFNPLTYPSPTASSDAEELGSRIEVETEGSSRDGRYVYMLDLTLKMRPKGITGRRGYGDRLAWNSYTSWNRLTDDRGVFSLKNDKPFYFSRVKAYEREGQSQAS